MNLYLKSINKNYSFLKLLKYAVILSAFLLIIDNLNLPYKYLVSYDAPLILISAIAVILVLLFTALEFKIFDILKMVPINLIDGMSITISISCLMYGSISAIYNQLYLYKLIVIISVTCIFVGIMLYRGIRFKKAITIAAKYQPNIIDLKEIFAGDFTIKEGKTILVNEKDVDYDLLERENVINQLYNAILQSNPDGRFVISLEGKWGSGKTTIINNVKNKLAKLPSIVIIDEFDPWSYCDQESLLSNMFDIILKKSGFKYSTLSTNKMAKTISENIFGNQRTGMILKSLFNQTNNTCGLLKNKINDYLKLCGKKIVFFIDNIDRAENDNIILLFKLVGNVFDFERVTYILSFDNDRIKKIFEDEPGLDYQYLKKVIQMQIRVPEMDRNVLVRLFERCLHNLLIAYGESENNMKYYNSIIDCMCKQAIDIRDFKRFINSVISIQLIEGRYLNKRDLLFIEYIRLYNLTLYQQIYRNRVYFISHDKIADGEIFGMSFNGKEFNLNGKNYFNNLFADENNCCYMSVLEEIFPYVKRYKSKQDLVYDGVFPSDELHSDVAKKRRICSAKYFDLYFTNTENEFLFVGKLVENLVNNLNQMTDLDGRKTEFNTLFESVHLSFHQEIFERFQLYIEDFEEDIIFDIITILFDKINEIDSSSAFISLSARQRVEIILWELLQKITNDQYIVFLKNIDQEYGKIEIICSILYWFENDKEDKNIDGRKQKMQTLYEEMGDSIVTNSINLYHDSYYSPKNAWGFYRLYKDDQIKVKDYTKKVLNGENVFRLLYDIIGLSRGTKFTYSIIKSNLDCITTEEDIDKILKNTIPISNDQKFIFEVYKKYKDGITDKWGETGVVTDEVKNLNL